MGLQNLEDILPSASAATAPACSADSPLCTTDAAAAAPTVSAAPTIPDAASPRMGARLAEAWRTGTLLLPMQDAGSPVRLPGLHPSVLPPSLSGPAEVELAGIGEHFAAWTVAPLRNAPVIVRIPHTDAAAGEPQAFDHEIAALALAPAGVGPEAVAFQGDPARSPLGLPYVVTTHVPGQALAPQAWTPAHLRAHARLLALLHTVAAPGRGPARLGKQPWKDVPREHSLLTEVEAAADSWRADHRELLAEHHLKPFLKAMVKRVKKVEPQIKDLDGFVLSHGDLCATNILWGPSADGGSAAVGAHAADGGNTADTDPSVRYIDFEWAQADDPARDLAILGGSVHAGPWYVPMGEEHVAGFVAAYVDERHRLAADQGTAGEVPASVSDVAALRARMRAWTAYERTGMLVHLASRAAGAPGAGADGAADAGRDGSTPDGGGSPMHRRAFAQLRRTLAVELGID
ncbi:aminoglycoside phosphotransferase family protein [Brachybacterium sp. DNPG3]